MNKQFKVVIRDVQGLWQVVVDKRPTLRGAESSMVQWQLLIGAASADRFLDVFLREAPIANRAEG